MELQQETNYPTSFTFQDVASVLNEFKETQGVNEQQRVKKFSHIISSNTGTATELRLSEPFNKNSYLTSFIKQIKERKQKMLEDTNSQIKNVVTKLKEFITNIANQKDELKNLIEGESSLVRAQLLGDPEMLCRLVTSAYNTNITSLPLYEERYNKLKYGIRSVIWQTEFDMSTFEEGEEKNKDLKDKFTMLKKLVDSLKQCDKDYFMDMIRELVRYAIAVFMIMRTNVYMPGHASIFHFSSFLALFKIADLKELVVFDKDPFIINGVKLSGEDYEKRKAEIGYDRLMNESFSRYIIDTSNFKL